MKLGVAAARFAIVSVLTLSSACGGGGAPPTPAPLVLSTSVGSGPQFGRTSIAITGSNFQSGAVVGMRPLAPTGLFVYTEDVTFVDSNTLVTRTVPSAQPPNTGPTPAEIIVVNPDGQSDRLSGAFVWTAMTCLPPKIDGAIDNSLPLIGSGSDLSFDPSNAGSTPGGESRMILGTNFELGATVTIGGAPAIVTAYSSPSYVNSAG